MHLIGEETSQRLDVVPAQFRWQGSQAFAKRQRELSSEQYEMVEVRTSRGMNRAMLFSQAVIRAKWEANAPSRERWPSSVSGCAP
jgi:hypothetical protein